MVVSLQDSTVVNLEKANLSLDRLSEEINKGFGIEWNASNNMYDECIRSQGLCGSDNTTSEFRFNLSGISCGLHILRLRSWTVD